MPTDAPESARPHPVAYPGAEPPARRTRIDAWGVGIAAYEWGPENGPPLFLVHGGFDFAQTFSVFAPLLAAGGWRVVSWDQRGHGDSDHTQLYNWEADIRDLVAVMDRVTDRPAPIVGHSKGGGLCLQIAAAHPHRFTKVVNLDGMPSRHRMPDVADHERTRMLATEVAEWLDHRRRTSAGRARRPGTLDELARRRGLMNPRLTVDWLRFLVGVGARQDPDGWRWKLDPSLRPGGFGPWRPDWTMRYLAGLTQPFLGFLATEPEPMGWGTALADVRPYLPRDGRVEVLDGVGHFVHIEQPELLAGKILEFLA